MAAEVGESCSLVYGLVDGAYSEFVVFGCIEFYCLESSHDVVCLFHDFDAFSDMCFVVPVVAADKEDFFKPVDILGGFIGNDFVDDDAYLLFGSTGESAEVDIGVEVHVVDDALVIFGEDTVLVGIPAGEVSFAVIDVGEVEVGEELWFDDFLCSFADDNVAVAWREIPGGGLSIHAAEKQYVFDTGFFDGLFDGVFDFFCGVSSSLFFVDGFDGAKCGSYIAVVFMGYKWLKIFGEFLWCNDEKIIFIVILQRWCFWFFIEDSYFNGIGK